MLKYELVAMFFHINQNRDDTSPSAHTMLGHRYDVCPTFRERWVKVYMMLVSPYSRVITVYLLPSTALFPSRLHQGDSII